MATKNNPELIGTGHRELRISFVSLPLDQWDNLKTVRLYLTKPSGLKQIMDIAKTTIHSDKILRKMVLFAPTGLYVVAISLLFTNGEWLSQRPEQWDYLQADGLIEN